MSIELPMLETLPGLYLYDARPLCPSNFKPVHFSKKQYVAIHSTGVAGQANHDPILVIKAIAKYHEQYGGFGYNALVDANGNGFLCGDWNTSRAGVGQVPDGNEKCYHIVFPGEFSKAQPTQLQLVKAREICAHLDYSLGRRLIIIPHCGFNVGPESWRSKWNTVCPGTTWPIWIGDIMPLRAS